MYLNTIYLGRGVYGVETAAQSYFGKSVVGARRSPKARSSPGSSTSRRGTSGHRAIRPSAAKSRARRREGAPQLRHRPDGQDRASISGRRGASARRRRRSMSSPSASALEAPVLRRPRPASARRAPQQPDAGARPALRLPRHDAAGALEATSTCAACASTPRSTPARRTPPRTPSKLLPTDLDRLSVALAAIEPSTGYVRALIGGRDYYPDCENEGRPEDATCCRLAKLNLALGEYGGGSGRQPGSSFKPFVLDGRARARHPAVPTYPSRSVHVSDREQRALEGRQLRRRRRRQPHAGRRDRALGQRGVRAPRGRGRRRRRRVRRRGARRGDGAPDGHRVPDARASSRNGAAKNYLKIDACIPADRVPAIALGAKEVVPLEMASAYSALANDGIARRADGDRPHRGRRTDASCTTPTRAACAPCRPASRAASRTRCSRCSARGTGTAAQARPSVGRQDRDVPGVARRVARRLHAAARRRRVGRQPVPDPLSRDRVDDPVQRLPDGGSPAGRYPAQIWHAFMTDALAKVPPMNFRPPPSALFRGGARVTASPDPSASPDASTGRADAGAGTRAVA